MAAVDHQLLVVFVSVLCVSIFCVSCLDLSLDDDQEEIECHGTSVGFGYSGTLEMHYKHLHKRYSGCTHIIGNLEITNLVDPKIKYDLNFLKKIRYVSGSVLLGLITEVDHIPLLSLEVIRGNSTYYLQGDHYGLVVVLTSRSNEETSGLKELRMPQLKEITNGKILFTGNPSLGYVNTIDWTPLLRGRREDVHFFENAFNESATNASAVSVCEHGERWGEDLALCQKVPPSYLPCHEDCDGLCFGPDNDQCCHSSCAVGCVDPGHENCLLCKDYKYDGYCAGFCPAKSYPMCQNCVKYD